MAAMTAMLRASDAFRAAAAHAEIVYAHVVEGAPGGDVAYRVGIHGGEAVLARGDPGSADVVATTGYRTAVEIARGDLTFQNAYMSRRATLAGDTGRFLANQAVLAVLDALRDRVPTRYPEPPPNAGNL